MPRWSFVVLIVVSAVFTGCSAGMKMVPVVDDTPSWVKKGIYKSDGYIYAVGSTTIVKKNIAFARTKAELAGRSKILRFLNDNPPVNGYRYTEDDVARSEACDHWHNFEIMYALMRWGIPK
ncbi:MAG: hypothetical protein WC619_02050 [Patescibacteria group bacterium]